MKAHIAKHKEDNPTQSWRHRRSNQEGRGVWGWSLKVRRGQLPGAILRRGLSCHTALGVCRNLRLGWCSQLEFLAFTMAPDSIWAHRPYGLRYDWHGPQTKEPLPQLWTWYKSGFLQPSGRGEERILKTRAEFSVNSAGGAWHSLNLIWRNKETWLFFSTPYCNGLKYPPHGI